MLQKNDPQKDSRVKTRYEGVDSNLEQIFTALHVILASILCHGKAMSAFEIDVYHDISCMRAIQLPNLGEIVRNLPFGISEDLGVTKFVGA